MRSLINASLLLWQSAEPAPQSVGEVLSSLRTRLLQAIPGLMTAAIVFLIFLLVAWIGYRIIAYAAPRVRADTGVVLLLSRVYYYSIIIFGIVTALATAGLNVNALVASVGLTGFALGFALKDVLSNLLSGIMLLIYRPFCIGDQIKLNDYEGTIKEIRMRDTVMRAFDGRNVIIPNTLLITQVVVNNTTSKLIRESVTIAVPVDAKINEVRELFLREMEKNSAITGRVETPIRLKQIDQDTVQLEGRYWFDPRSASGATVKNEVVQAIKTMLQGAGIEIREATGEEPEKRPSGAEVVKSGEFAEH